MQQAITSYIEEYKGNLTKLLSELPQERLAEAFEVLWDVYQNDKQIFFCGNGGSAASSSHIAQDLAKGSMGSKANLPIRPVRALALTDNIGQITAWANDTGYDNIFVGQLKVLLNPGDAIVGISCSGNSPNVVNAVRFAKARGNPTIAFVGFEGGELAKIAHVVVHIRDSHYGRIEDLHMSMGHMIAYWFQKVLVTHYEAAQSL